MMQIAVFHSKSLIHMEVLYAPCTLPGPVNGALQKKCLSVVPTMEARLTVQNAMVFILFRTDFIMSTV